MAIHSKHKNLLAFIFGVLLLAGIIYLIYIQVTDNSQFGNSVIVPPSGPIKIAGTMVCLPHKDTSGPQTLECAFGLKDDLARYFILRDLDASYSNIAGVPINSHIFVEGTFIREDNNKYLS